MRAITMTECSSAKTEQPNGKDKAAAALKLHRKVTKKRRDRFMPFTY